MPNKPRLAVIASAYYPHSHSDVIVTRWLQPFPTDHQFGWPIEGNLPRTDIASMYIAQFPQNSPVGKNDIGREIAKRHNIPLFSTIHDALTLGNDKLAVDGVLLICEHGNYPFNELGQKMYPRREMFDEIVQVFRDSERCVPVYNDKYLSYDADSAIHMVDTARAMNIPLMAGSSIPHAGFVDAWKMPKNVAITEAVGAYYDGLAVTGCHEIDFLQTFVAQRRGGESGIKTVTAYYGDSFWQAEKEGMWSHKLMEAAVNTARHRNAGDYHQNVTAVSGTPKPLAPMWPAAFCFEHNDGMRSSYLMLQGHIKDFTVALRAEDGTIFSGCSRTSIGKAEEYHAHFAKLAVKIEEFMLTGKAPAPLEHYLLTTLAIDSAIHALQQPGKIIPTPEMNLQYIL